MSTNPATPPPDPSSSIAKDLRGRRLRRIAARAYELYEARGGNHGMHVDDWLRAEREIEDEIQREAHHGGHSEDPPGR